MKKFKVSTAADADLRSIAAYALERWGKHQRDIYISELFEAFARLSKNPEIAINIDDIRRGYRKFPRGSHVIYFRNYDTASIEIIRVLHKSMDAESQLRTL